MAWWKGKKKEMRLASQFHACHCISADWKTYLGVEKLNCNKAIKPSSSIAMIVMSRHI